MTLQWECNNLSRASSRIVTGPAWTRNIRSKKLGLEAFHNRKNWAWLLVTSGAEGSRQKLSVWSARFVWMSKPSSHIWSSDFKHLQLEIIRCNKVYRRLGPQAIQICFDVCSIHQMLLWGQPGLSAGAILAPGEIKILIHETNWASCHTYSHRRNNLYDCNLNSPSFHSVLAIWAAKDVTQLMMVGANFA